MIVFAISSKTSLDFPSQILGADRETTSPDCRGWWGIQTKGLWFPRMPSSLITEAALLSSASPGVEGLQKEPRQTEGPG